MPIERRNIFGSRSSATLSPSTVRCQDSEVVPDSEEERQQQSRKDTIHIVLRKVVEVIEISSDESEDDVVITISPTKPSALSKTPSKTGLSGRPQYSKRRVIESSDDDSEPEIIELTDSSDEDKITVVKAKTTKFPVAQDVTSLPGPWRATIDEAVLIFDEPRSARTPVRGGIKKPSTMSSKLKDTASQTPKIRPIVNIGSSSRIPDLSENSSATPVSSRVAKSSTQETPRRNTKKTQLEAEQNRRHKYAQELFTDLNKVVFKQGLPESTKLNWNKRLLTTAGRAKFHRSREGVQTTEIELAEKILDCDERIRNTLSHEMCHLATWVIDKKIDEHHGKLFKYWASHVMTKRPDIHVSVKHDYEISYPFNWKCAKCAKIYGRFSKSIRPDECRCGACKEGILIPLFKTRGGAESNTGKLSRMAAAKPQDSPRTGLDNGNRNISLDHSDSDSEVKAIADILALTSIEHH